MRKQKSFPFWLVLFSLLFYASCRKSDFGTTAKKPTSIDRFFNVSESADPRLKSIARSIKAQEKEYSFLEKFTQKTGWPVWAKAKVIDKNNLNGERGSTIDSSALVYIPFVHDNAIVVNAVLAVRMNASDTVWRVLYPNHYESFGFSATTNGDWNARNVFQFFALFQYDIFGHTKFLIKDERLFNTQMDSYMVTLKERNGVVLNGRTSRTTEWHETTECLTLTLCPGQIPARSNSITDDCYDVTNCNTYYWNDGVDLTGGTGWTGGGWSGNGNGGGGSGGWGTTNNTCTNAANGTPIACPPGWEPINVDSRGYHLDRIALLQSILDQDPYFLIPCDYLSQFQAMGSFQAPQPVRDRLNTLNNAYETWLAQNGFAPSTEPEFNLLMLDNAAGTVVNCDYFPIKITVLPTINGVQWTPQQVFEYFKNNINSVINTSIAEFEPYEDLVVNDETLWNSANPFTALLHIDMIDDGSVIISDYQVTPNLCRMKASTLNSPIDYDHPVSGTREWGIQSDPNGGFFFYTTAVDRMTQKFTEVVDDIITTFGGASGFSKGDDLWRSLQNKMMEFINTNGGQAQLYSNDYVAARPDYSAIRDFLLGNIDLPTMRQRIGCP